MVDRRILVLALAMVGVAMMPAAFAASFKCQTKGGITYQDKPCADPQPEAVAATSKDADRARDTLRPAQRQVDRPKSVAVEARALESPEYAEWQERSARKSDALKRCATAQPRCNADSLRDAALYLSERQLETALGAPAETETLGLERTSRWTIQVSEAGKVHNARLTAGWGLCSDEKRYFASGQGQRACRVNVE